MKKKLNICVVRSKYNDTTQILRSATNELKKRKVYFKILEVPGAFEIPVMIAKNINKFDGFLAIGSIIKGKTPNFDFISQAITHGLIQLSILNRKPIGNAILTCLNQKQVKMRASKGYEAVIAVCEVLNVKQ